MGRARSETRCCGSKTDFPFLFFFFLDCNIWTEIRTRTPVPFLIFPFFFFDLIPIEVTTLRTISLKNGDNGARKGMREPKGMGGGKLNKTFSLLIYCFYHTCSARWDRNRRHVVRHGRPGYIHFTWFSTKAPDTFEGTIRCLSFFLYLSFFLSVVLELSCNLQTLFTMGFFLLESDTDVLKPQSHQADRVRN